MFQIRPSVPWEVRVRAMEWTAGRVENQWKD
jgi:hypothetical protein